MNSSPYKPDIFRSLIHPLMSISVAATASLCGLYLVIEAVGLRTPSAAIVMAVGLAPVVEAVVGNLIYRERAGIGNRVRELIIYLVLVYAVLSVVQPGPFAARFVPTYHQLVPLIPVALGWLIAFTFHNRLRGREGLLAIIRGKRDADLRRAILDRQHDMALTVGELRTARKMIFALFVVFGVIAGFGTTRILDVSRVTTNSAGFVFFLLYGLA
ncbi:MAG: hypothetical protein E4H09_00100, partial [Spirochaetales bacterium]